MDSSLSGFCDAVRGRECHALAALLKIAETKDAILNWERDSKLLPSHSSSDAWPTSIATTLAVALAQVDQAEETILDAFCLIRQKQSSANTQTA